MVAMPRDRHRQTTCDLPRYFAREIRTLIAEQRTPAASVNEYVRQAVARQLREDKEAPRAVRVEAKVASSFGADPTPAKPGLGPADDRRSVPGTLKPGAVRADDGSVA